MKDDRAFGETDDDDVVKDGGPVFDQRDDRPTIGQFSGHSLRGAGEPDTPQPRWSGR